MRTRQIALVLMLIPCALGAQVEASVGRLEGDSGVVAVVATDSARQRSHTQRSHTVRSALRYAGVTALAAAALMPLDATFSEMMRDPGVQDPVPLRQAASFFNAAGSPGVLITSVGMYGVGQAIGHSRLATIGAHATQAVILSGAVTTLVKIGAGRQRPFVEQGDSDDFSPGRGYREGLTSFPSGHATAAFAFAAAVTEDLRESNPRLGRIVGPLLYLGAASVGAARIYDNRHWTSDVVVGAGIGTFVGRALVRHANENPDNWLDRQFRVVNVQPSADGGIALSAHFTFR